jgi:pimeloyl-ACP methyl ester carboxylesterase
VTRRKARPAPSRPAPVRPAGTQRFARLEWRVYGYVLLALLSAVLIVSLAVWARPLWVLERVAYARLATEGFHSRSVIVGGERIHYFVGGHGSPVVLVHGLGAEATYWANLMPQLSGSGHRVYALDLLGYGTSAKPAGSQYSIPEEASVVEGFLGVLGLDHVDLAGWSMGGWVAMRVALDDPGRIARLMLFDAAGIRFAPDYDATLFAPRTPAQLDRLYALLMPRPPRMPAFLTRDVLRRMARQQWVIERSAASMFSGRDLEDGKLGNLKMPVLIVWGKEDHLLPLSTGMAMHADIPQSVLEVFDGCGHLAPGQCADRVGPRVNAWLRGQPPQAHAVLEIPQG